LIFPLSGQSLPFFPLKTASSREKWTLPSDFSGLMELCDPPPPRILGRKPFPQVLFGPHKTRAARLFPPPKEDPVCCPFSLYLRAGALSPPPCVKRSLFRIPFPQANPVLGWLFFPLFSGRVLEARLPVCLFPLPPLG